MDQPPSLATFLDTVHQRDPHQPEFSQAVREVMSTLWPFLEANPRYRQLSLLERLVEPDRVIQFRVAWVDDRNQVQVNRAWRVQFSSAIGPYKGGMRFHPSVNLSILKFLGFEQTFNLSGLNSPSLATHKRKRNDAKRVNSYKYPAACGIGIYTSFTISAVTLQHDLNLSIGGIDARLNRRHQCLVKQHMTPAAPLSSAIKDVASARKTTFATTQAVWRFLNNDRVTFSQLNQPLTELARHGIASSPHSYALVVHDWSRLQFHSHYKKHDRLKMTHAGDAGYELQSSLLADAASGLPVVPLAQTLTDSKGCRSTLADGLTDSQTHMDALTADITRAEALGIGKTLVHLIDREGDSVAHMRALSAQGLRWLIRGKEGHQVTYQSHSHSVGAVADGLVFGASKPVDYKGKKACLSVGEAPVTLTRVAKPKRTNKQLS